MNPCDGELKAMARVLRDPATQVVTRQAGGILTLEVRFQRERRPGSQFPLSEAQMAEIAELWQRAQEESGKGKLEKISSEESPVQSAFGAVDPVVSVKEVQGIMDELNKEAAMKDYAEPLRYKQTDYQRGYDKGLKHGAWICAAVLGGVVLFWLTIT